MESKSSTVLENVFPSEISKIAAALQGIFTVFKRYTFFELFSRKMLCFE